VTPIADRQWLDFALAARLYWVPRPFLPRLARSGHPRRRVALLQGGDALRLICHYTRPAGKIGTSSWWMAVVRRGRMRLGDPVSGDRARTGFNAAPRAAVQISPRLAEPGQPRRHAPLARRDWGQASHDLGGGPINLRRQDLTGRHGFVTYLFGRGAVAQLEEHLNGIQGVRGSNPLSSTNNFKGLATRS
jgi:hypothetical protein